MQHVLLIEDDDSIRKLFRVMLERDGYRVTDVANGLLGLEAHAQDPADLIITDMFMPEKEGIETIMEVRKNDADVKIIAISGGGTQGSLDYLTIAKALGAARTLPKPVTREQLLTSVREVLAE